MPALPPQGPSEGAAAAPLTPRPSCPPQISPRGGRTGRGAQYLLVIHRIPATSSSPQPCRVGTLSPHLTDGEAEAEARSDLPEATLCRGTHRALSADLPDSRVPTQSEDTSLASRSHRGRGAQRAWRGAQVQGALEAAVLGALEGFRAPSSAQRPLLGPCGSPHCGLRF